MKRIQKTGSMKKFTTPSGKFPSFVWAAGKDRRLKTAKSRKPNVGGPKAVQGPQIDGLSIFEPQTAFGVQSWNLASGGLVQSFKLSGIRTIIRKSK
jgi:hypothetical protein